MDVSAPALVKLLLPRAPSILMTIVMNKLSLSANSSKQDTTTEVATYLLRSIMSAKRNAKKVQEISLKDPGIKGTTWISKVTIPAPQDTRGLGEALEDAVQQLGDGNETFRSPGTAPVQAEWTGFRKGVDKNAPELEISEEEKYEKMMADVESPVTILYFHGGGYFLMSPASHRGTTSQLAKLTKGRCLSVAYRLAPQHPFPAQILDALCAYFYLLCPPPGSLHEAVPAGKIIFAGDSAGGNLSLALTQTLLTMQRMGLTSISYHGRRVPVELPAGVAVNSPWCDITRSLPSNVANAQYDYLSPPNEPGGTEILPPDEIWPSTPPRVQMYCDASMLTHPLASPLAAPPELWKSCPPVFLCCGNEGLEDDASVTARRLYHGGASVVFRGYEGMPHCFAMIFPTSPVGRDCFKEWAGFCVEAVEGQVQRADTGRWTKAFSNAQTHLMVPFDEITKLTDEEVLRLMQEAKQATVLRETKLTRQWETDQSKPHL